MFSIHPVTATDLKGKGWRALWLARVDLNKHSWWRGRIAVWNKLACFLGDFSSVNQAGALTCWISPGNPDRRGYGRLVCGCCCSSPCRAPPPPPPREPWLEQPDRWQIVQYCWSVIVVQDLTNVWKATHIFFTFIFVLNPLSPRRTDFIWLRRFQIIETFLHPANPSENDDRWLLPWWDISLGCQAADWFSLVMMLNYTTGTKGGHRAIHQGWIHISCCSGHYSNPLRYAALCGCAPPPFFHTRTQTDHYKLLEGTSHSFIHGESLWWCQLVPSLLSYWKLMEAATARGRGEAQINEGL